MPLLRTLSSRPFPNQFYILFITKHQTKQKHMSLRIINCLELYSFGAFKLERPSNKIYKNKEPGAFSVVAAWRAECCANNGRQRGNTLRINACASDFPSVALPRATGDLGRSNSFVCSPKDIGGVGSTRTQLYSNIFPDREIITLTSKRLI